MQRRDVLASLLLASCAAHAPARPRQPVPGSPAKAAREPERRELELFRQFPKLRGELPRVELARLPTPVESAPELARELGLGSLWVKRDDHAADPYGGNKVRKLELLLGQALAEKRRTVLTFGGVGSNHALATAVHARRLGLEVILALLPQHGSDEVRDHLLAASALGAELHLARAIDEALAARPFAARTPYVIPTGGTVPLGDAGLVSAGLELAAQVAEGLLPEPDEIWVALGTAGTAAGIALGVAAAGLDTRVIGVRVSSPRHGSFANLARVFAETRDFLRARDPGFPALEPAERVTVIDGFAGRGYGIPSERGRQAQRLARERVSLALDDTYTAKTLAALISNARSSAAKSVLFWHTYDARRLAPPEADPSLVPAELRGFVRRR